MSDGDSIYSFTQPAPKKDPYTETDWSIASTVGRKGKNGWWERHHKVTRYQGSYNKNWEKKNTDFNQKDKQGRNLYETDAKLIANRKAAFTEGFYSQAKDWKGNEWMKKALDQAWDKNEFGIRGAYTKRTYGGYKTVGENQEGFYGGYGSLGDKELNELGHTYAAKAQQMFETDQKNKETDRMLSERKARGGMGSRGSTLLTGGREGVLGEATTRRKTLIGGVEG